MLHLHATKKLLNIGHITGAVFVTKEDGQQHLQNWFVTLTGSGYPGKSIILYVHQPSLLTIFVKGKTVKSTYNEFIQRLQSLLQRFDFPASFIDYEISLAKEHVVGKTSSASMLSHINQILFNAECWFSRYNSYEAIDLDWIENQMMNYLFKSKGQKQYNFPLKYWEEKLGCKLLQLPNWP
jgi:hypothetical protein